jgi:uncharacterized protein
VTGLDKKLTRVIDAHVYCLPTRLWDSLPELRGANEAILSAIHRHTDAKWVLPLSSPDAISHSMTRAGIDGAILVSFPWATHRHCVENNRLILQTAKRDSRFSAICSIQPLSSDWRVEAEACKRAGAVGLKVNASWQGFELDSIEMHAVSKWAAEHGLFIMTHVDQAFKKSPASAAHLLALAEENPNTQYLAAHLGGMLGLYAPLKGMAARLRNVWFDTAVSASLYMVRMYVDCGLQDKLVFGTDFPFNHSHEQAQVIEGVRALGLGDQQEAAIFHGNIARLLAYGRGGTAV